MFFRRHKFIEKQRQKEEQMKSQFDNLSPILTENLETLRLIYSDCSDVVFRPFSIGEQFEAYIIYVEGLSNIEELDTNVLGPLMRESADADNDKDLNFSELVTKKISVSKIQEVHTFADCIEHLANGFPVMLVEGENSGFALGLAKWEKRSIEEPATESVVRGPREGFVETLGVNTSLLRRKLKSPHFKLKSMKVGRYTQTEISLAYIEGITDKTLIKEVEERIQKIDIDGILESEYIEELIEDNSYSPFPQLMTTERPDVAVSSLLEGRVVILVDGTPFVLIAPTTLFSLLQSSEDYYKRFMVGSVIRWLRYVLVFISLVFPSLYVSVLSYHQEMVPTNLIVSIAASREGIPFPALVEALLMEFTFEAIREAGIRLPKQVGAAVSIVGALVIGQAAIEAGLTSAPMVMVVALTGIASFTIPNYDFGFAIRLLRFPLTILGGILGLLGVMFGLLFIIIHLCKLRSFGEPYLSPLAPMGRGLRDVLVREPLWKMNTRPHLSGVYNKYRQAPHQKPEPKRGGETSD
ncbi:spore germination protein [Alkalihalobacillus deserti]|uniref:spore germination protein n=1 Tax=Alkalihalobacillus deserti TaxID=2879466 RepID=UPI001D13CC01|nr:spore germination protein [Alkalihalobacillus deserti]